MPGGDFYCGPLAVSVAAPEPALRTKVEETLDLYTVRWPPPHLCLRLEIRRTEVPAAARTGTFLTCGRMLVDATAEGFAATCRSGTSCESSDGDGARWTISVPRATHTGEAVPEDIEDLVGLALTTGWRRLGFVPVHAGAIGRDDGGVCALLCATSGGGKTTLTAALVRRGWTTLGDDKLLLALDPGRRPRLEALLHTFNLHPNARRWFPEVGDLTVLPRYSAWTDKRKVRIGEIWPGVTRERGRPTHLVRIHRRPEATDGDDGGVRVRPLDAGEVLSTLLRQTVIPNDRGLARRTLATVAATAGRLVGLEVELGHDAYREPDCLALLEAALR